MTDLLPCPFCGRRPTAFEYDDHRGITRHQVACFDLKCPAHEVLVSEDTPEAAAKAWNTRAPDWQPIETAPRYRNVIVWSEKYNSDPFVARLTCAEQEIPESATERKYWTEDELFEDCWYTDGYGWLEGVETPTHWRPLPEAPA